MITAAVETALARFKADDHTDAERMQTKLWACAVPCSPATAALGIIDRLGVTFDQTDTEASIEALGILLAHAAVMLATCQLSISPIVELAQVYRRRLDVEPAQAPSAVARAARPSVSFDPTAHDVPRREMVADAVALAIAKALDDVEVGHQVVVQPLELLVVVGKEIQLPTWQPLRPAHHPDPEIDRVYRVSRKLAAFDALRQMPDLEAMPDRSDPHEDRISWSWYAGGVPMNEAIAELRMRRSSGEDPARVVEDLIGRNRILLDAHRRAEGKSLTDSVYCMADMSRMPDRAGWRCKNGHEVTDMQALATSNSHVHE